MASASNTFVAGLEYNGGQIIVYRGNQAVCRNQGCLASVDRIAAKLYATTLSIRNFFWLKFGLRGIDGHGEIPPLVIGWNQDNAQWICTSLSAHSCFLRFHDQYAVQPKIVAHEYTHGIVARVKPLHYRNESGALNESLADVFGIVFNYWKSGRRDLSWTIADRDISVHVDVEHNRLPLSLYPSRWNDYGNVHHNSCIPSHAFFVAAQLIGGPRDEAIARIWFLAFLNATPNETFIGFALKTIVKSRILFGENHRITQAVGGAWVSVGVLRYTIPQPIQEHNQTQALNIG